MPDPEWTVQRSAGDTVQVTAETWWVNDNGDLLFGMIETVTLHGIGTLLQRPSRAFAAGTWDEVRLYA